MRPARARPRISATAAALALIALLVLVGAAPADGGGAAPRARAAVAELAAGGSVWQWPVVPPRVVNEYEAPSHDYGPGHRGIDLTASGAVHAPADGVVAFVGVVVDRPLITIDHVGGYVSTFEPLETELSSGDAVSAGDVIGEAASGGHAPAGSVHFGVRLNGEYINPMLLLGGVPRAVLLPCC